MSLHRMFALGLAFALVASTVTVAEEAVALKSGPQVGSDLAGPFHPVNVNGKNAGKKHCLYCENGNAPVAMIFAREPSANLTKLIKKLDAACVKNDSCKMGAFVVFCSDEEGITPKLKKIATGSNLKKVVLSVDNPAGPKGYMINKAADVTVVLYSDRNVKANYALRNADLTDAKIATIVSDVRKILPKE